MPPTVPSFTPEDPNRQQSQLPSYFGASTQPQTQGQPQQPQQQGQQPPQVQGQGQGQQGSQTYTYLLDKFHNPFTKDTDEWKAREDKKLAEARRYFGQGYTPEKEPEGIQGKDIWGWMKASAPVVGTGIGTLIGGPAGGALGGGLGKVLSTAPFARGGQVKDWHNYMNMLGKTKREAKPKKRKIRRVKKNGMVR